MKSTFSRYLVAATVLMLASLILTGLFFQVLMRNYLTDHNVKNLKKDALVIAELVQAAYGDKALQNRDFTIAMTVASAISNADAVVCDASGRLVICAESPLGCEHIGKVLNKNYLQRVFDEGGLTDTGKVEGLYEDVRYVVSVPVYNGANRPIAVVMVSQAVSNLSAVMSRIIELLVFVAVLVIVGFMVIVFFFTRQQSSPLRDMAKVASAFGHGDLTARARINSHDSREVQELATAFNNMASSLEKSEYQREEFVANVSHELKTPMTTIGGYVDGILDGTIPPEKQSHYLQIVSDETKRLNRLVRSMLDISRLQSQGGIPEEKMTRFDLEEELGSVLISFEQKINEKHLDVQVDMPEHPVYTIACRDYITQVIYNLIDNAVKFSPVEGKLEIAIREGSDKSYVSIANAGETIPPEELPLVFDRFHKMDKSRSQNRDSWGLGLYIVKTIVCSHGEDISVTSRDHRTSFTFTMPRAN